MRFTKTLSQAITVGSISIILSACGFGSKVKWPAYTNYVIDQTCRITNPNFMAMGIAYQSVPLMLMDSSNPYYDADAASEWILMSQDGIRPQSEQDEMIIDIASGIIKKCPKRLSKREFAEIKGLVDYYKKNNVYCLQFADASYKKCLEKG